MIQSRSMTPKTFHQVPLIASKTWITTSKRSESSFFLSLSISFLEIMIKFKSTFDYLTIFTASLKNTLNKVCTYASESSLNGDIIRNYWEIIDLFKKTPSQAVSFNYLRYYSESDDYNCFITLEYTMRFIVAYLLSSEDKVEESQIIEDQGIGNYFKAIEKLTNEFPITVIVIENHEDHVYMNKTSQKQANIFLLKNESEFSIVYPEEFYNLFGQSFISSREIEKFPFVSFQNVQMYAQGYSSVKSFNKVKRDSFFEHQTNFRDLNSFGYSTTPINGILERQQVLKESSVNSNNEKESSEGQNITTDEDSDLNISIKSSDSDTLIEITIKKFQKVLCSVNKRLKIDLNPNLNSFFENQKRKKICISEMKRFFILNLPSQRYTRNCLKRLCRSLHHPLHSIKIKEAVYWELVINSDVDPTKPDVSKSAVIKLILKTMKYLIQMKLQQELIIRN